MFIWFKTGQFIDFDCLFSAFLQFDGSVCAKLGIKVKFAWTVLLKAETIKLVIAIWLIYYSLWQVYDQRVTLDASIAVENFHIDSLLFSIGNGARLIEIAAKNRRICPLWELICEDIFENLLVYEDGKLFVLFLKTIHHNVLTGS